MSDITAADFLKFSAEIGEPLPIKEVVSSHRCEGCKKILRHNQLRKITGGCRVAIDNICDDCWPYFKEYPPIICVKCGVVAARIKPHRQPKTGFEFKSGRVYHVEECPSCSSRLDENNAVAVRIIEVHQYLKQYGRK